jgi:hypothetical protein
MQGKAMIEHGGFTKKGYYPLTLNRYAGLAWQGELLKDFWMWNRQYNEYQGNIKHIQTIKVADLKEAALRYWRDGWVPIRPIGEDLLRRMENALRAHSGLKAMGMRFPDTPFLKPPEPIEDRFLGPKEREMLGMPKAALKRLRQRDEPNKVFIESYKRSKTPYKGSSLK